MIFPYLFSRPQEDSKLQPRQLRPALFTRPPAPHPFPSAQCEVHELASTVFSVSSSVFCFVKITSMYPCRSLHSFQNLRRSDLFGKDWQQGLRTGNESLRIIFSVFFFGPV